MRAVLVLLLVLFAAGAAVAGDASVRDEVQAALTRGDRKAALEALDAVLAPTAPRDRRRSVEAAHAAMDLVKGSDGNLRAVRILLDTLRRDATDAGGAYSLAMGFKKRLWEDFDVEPLLELLEGLVQVYSREMAFQQELALLLLKAGRLDEARSQYALIATLNPSDDRSRYELARLAIERGDVDEAIAVYDELLASNAQKDRKLDAHLWRANLLWHERGDFAGAERGIVAGRAAAQDLDPTPPTERFLARLAEEERAMRAEQDRRESLRALKRRLDASLWAVGAVWALVLGGGVLCLRRARWL